MMPRRLALAGTAVLVTAVPAAFLPCRVDAQRTPTGDGAPRIIVEPDFLASRDGSAPHVEVHIAANPRRTRNLIAGAITHTRADATTATKVYTTFDGGRVWTDTTFRSRSPTAAAIRRWPSRL